MINCPCCSGSSYEECCKPLHLGNLPENALQLMRSRYAAFVLNIPDYIVQTTHFANPQYSENKFSWKRSISQFSQHSSFQQLEVLDFKEKNAFAIVTFVVHMTQEGNDATFTERSLFEKVDQRWLYLGGKFIEGRAENLVFQRELKLLPLAYLSNPVLRKKADPILKITDEIKNLVEEMISTMDAFHGVGLAAPQVQHSLQLFVIHQPIENDKNSYEMGDIKVFINPKLSSPSEDTWIVPEGCLSIPGIRLPVKRPKAITVKYTDLNGNAKEERVSGWEARVIMHENDHINGTLFIDRLEKDEKSKWAPFIENLEKRLTT